MFRIINVLVQPRNYKAEASDKLNDMKLFIWSQINTYIQLTTSMQLIKSCHYSQKQQFSLMYFSIEPPKPISQTFLLNWILLTFKLKPSGSLNQFETIIALLTKWNNAKVCTYPTTKQLTWCRNKSNQSLSVPRSTMTSRNTMANFRINDHLLIESHYKFETPLTGITKNLSNIDGYYQLPTKNPSVK